MKSIRIVIIDHQVSFRAELRSLLREQDDIEIVGEAVNGWDGIELVKLLAPDIVLTEVKMPILDGIEVARRLQNSPVHLLILSAHAERSSIREAFANGVAGYLTKNEVPEYLAGAIRSVANNRTWFSPVIMKEMMAAGQNGALPHQNGALPQANGKTAEGSPGEDQDNQPTS